MRPCVVFLSLVNSILYSSRRLSQDIIRKQIEQHANYALKTEYSKEKYKKKKAAKWSNFFPVS